MAETHAFPIDKARRHTLIAGLSRLTYGFAAELADELRATMCPSCRGSGFAPYVGGDDDEAPCPACDGSGFAADPVQDTSTPLEGTRAHDWGPRDEGIAYCQVCGYADSIVVEHACSGQRGVRLPEGTDTREALRQARDDLAELGREHALAIHALDGDVEYSEDARRGARGRFVSAIARLDAALAAPPSRDRAGYAPCECGTWPTPSNARAGVCLACHDYRPASRLRAASSQDTGGGERAPGDGIVATRLKHAFVTADSSWLAVAEAARSMFAPVASSPTGSGADRSPCKVCGALPHRNLHLWIEGHARQECVSRPGEWCRFGDRGHCDACPIAYARVVARRRDAEVMLMGYGSKYVALVGGGGYWTLPQLPSPTGDREREARKVWVGWERDDGHWASAEELLDELDQAKLIADVAQLVRDLLAREGVNQSQLAERIGKTSGFVSQVLKGDRNMTLATLAELLSALGYRVTLTAASPSPTAGEPDAREPDPLWPPDCIMEESGYGEDPSVSCWLAEEVSWADLTTHLTAEQLVGPLRVVESWFRRGDGYSVEPASRDDAGACCYVWLEPAAERAARKGTPLSSLPHETQMALHETLHALVTDPVFQSLADSPGLQLSAITQAVAPLLAAPTAGEGEGRGREEAAWEAGHKAGIAFERAAAPLRDVEAACAALPADERRRHAEARDSILRARGKLPPEPAAGEGDDARERSYWQTGEGRLNEAIRRGLRDAGVQGSLAEYVGPIVLRIRAIAPASSAGEGSGR